jgi:hypothetical protein
MQEASNGSALSAGHPKVARAIGNYKTSRIGRDRRIIPCVENNFELE